MTRPQITPCRPLPVQLLEAVLGLVRRLATSRQAASGARSFCNRRVLVRPDGGMSELEYDDQDRLIKQLDRPPPGHGMSLEIDFATDWER